MMRAIDLCFSRKYLNSALKLIYAAIDNLAYLATNRQMVSKPDFIKWVNIFLLPNSNLSCTGEELYAQRCGLLHQNTVATCNLSSGMKNIFLYLGHRPTRKAIGTRRRIEKRPMQVYQYRITSGRYISGNAIVSKSSALKDSLLKRAQKYFANIDDKAV